MLIAVAVVLERRISHVCVQFSSVRETGDTCAESFAHATSFRAGGRAGALHDVSILMCNFRCEVYRVARARTRHEQEGGRAAFRWATDTVCTAAHITGNNNHVNMMHNDVIQFAVFATFLCTVFARVACSPPQKGTRTFVSMHVHVCSERAYLHTKCSRAGL